MQTNGSTNGHAPAADPRRAKFLAKVRKALGHDAAHSPPPLNMPAYNEPIIRQVPTQDPNRVNRWIQQAHGNAMKVARVPAAGVLPAIDGFIAHHQIQRAMVCAGQPGEQAGVAAHLQSKNIQVHHWQPGPDANAFHNVYECDLSVTDCRYGLADTGALLVWSDPAFGRSVTLTTPVHIVLLPAHRIVGDLVDGLQLALKDNAGQLPSNVVVINGPSKTADIEMKLVTGVHGPKYLYVVVIDP